MENGTFIVGKGSHRRRRLSTTEAKQGITIPTPAALLFVHGIALDHSVWKSQVGEFSRDYRVVSVDLRGYSCSTAANPDISLENHAQNLAALVDG